jgi:hypothetical protein
MLSLFEVIKLVYQHTIFCILKGAPIHILWVEFAHISFPPLIEHLDELGVEVNEMVPILSVLPLLIVLCELAQA